ncbi:hypothetical protein K525DRAFT_244019 [Schizophyllum commune Loenen D]|nr:hypothetical protein K525DRAFT_244019 [Schizophyllum commune Loenen D]
MARAKVTKPSAQDAQPSATASGAHPSQPAPYNAQPPTSVPAVLVPRNMLRAELESRSPKSLTSLIFSLMAKLPSTVPFVAKQANTALVFGSSDMRLPDTIVVPAKVWFGKDEGEGDGDAGDEGETAGKGKAKGKGRGKVKADRDKEKELWTKDPTLDEDEVVGGSDKENAEGKKPATQAKGKGKEPAAPLKGKEPVANARGKEQTKGKEHATQPDASRKRAASRAPSPTPRPQSKRRKADENVPSGSSTPSAPFSPAGVFTLTCPYLSEAWPDACANPLILRLAPSSTGSHLWGAFKLGVLDGVLRSTTPPPFIPSKAIEFIWRARSSGDVNEDNEPDVEVDDDDQTGTLLFMPDGTLRGVLEGAFLPDEQCIFLARRKTGDKRFRAPGERLLKQWKREWRKLPGEQPGGVGLWGRSKEPPAASDTSEDQTLYIMPAY